MRYGNNKFVSNPGSPFHTLYSPKVMKDGSIELVESGVQNTDEAIQSFAESCDRDIIFQRIANGELDLLEVSKGSFGDFTRVPNTFADVLQLQIDSKRLFDSLPGDIKSKFDNDPNKFFAQSGNKEWFEVMDSVLPKEYKSLVFGDQVVEKPVQSEVNTNE